MTPPATRGVSSAGVEAQELLTRVIAGDERAWDEVVDRFAGLVWSVARSYRLSSAATDDVVQTVWLRLAEHCSRIRQPERLASWLATTTRNEALRVIRGNNRLTPQAALDELPELTTPSVEERVSDDVTLRAVLRGVRQAVAGRPAADAAAVRRAAPRLPDDRRDARPPDRQHRTDQGPLPRASEEAPAARLRPERRTAMTVSDDELLALVGRALRAAEPVPDRVLTGARAAWTWRTIDEELAELVFDSAAELTGVRSEDTARQLTFRAPGSRSR